MILCAGEILIDQTERADSVVWHVGGAPFNVAVAAARGGADVRFYGKVGRDKAGDYIVRNAATYGLDMRLEVTPEHPTTMALVTVDAAGERSFRFARDNAADYQLDVADLDWRDVNIVHLGTLMLNTAQGRAFFEAALTTAKQKGVRVSVDANFRDDLFADVAQRNALMLPYLLSADILKLSEDELVSLAGCVDDAVMRLGYKGLLLCTMGARGSAAYYEGSLLASCPAASVARVVDTTGAGDAFFGTVLAALDGVNQYDAIQMARVLTAANAAGAAAVQREGAV